MRCSIAFFSSPRQYAPTCVHKRMGQGPCHFCMAHHKAKKLRSKSQGKPSQCTTQPMGLTAVCRAHCCELGTSPPLCHPLHLRCSNPLAPAPRWKWLAVTSSPPPATTPSLPSCHACLPPTTPSLPTCHALQVEALSADFAGALHMGASAQVPPAGSASQATTQALTMT